MNLGIKNKRAFVAASSQGLGFAVAKALLEEGCKVIINGRTESTLSKAKEKLNQFQKGSVDSVRGDLSIISERKEIIDYINATYKGIDILITNTGGPPAGSFTDHSKLAWDNAYELLLGSSVDIINAFLPSMKKNKWGRIIAITSIAIKEPVKGLILSNSVRASVMGLIKSLSQELGAYNITVNSVLPGYTATERLIKLSKTNPSIANIKNEIPLGRIGKPEEFAAAAAFLASEKASYITGVALQVDGGITKSLF